MSEVWGYAMQPSVFPTILQMERVARCHVVIVLNDVQLDRQTTNTLLVSRTGPVKVPLALEGRRRGKYCEQKIADPEYQAKKLFRQIEMIYGKQQGFKENKNRLEILTRLMCPSSLPVLSGIGWQILVALGHFLSLGVEKHLIASEVAEFRPPGCAGILELCKKAGITDYYQGADGLDGYFDKELVKKSGIRVWGQEYYVPRYKQLYGEFEPQVSILDPLMIGGGELARKVVGGSKKGRVEFSMRRWA